MADTKSRQTKSTKGQTTAKPKAKGGRPSKARGASMSSDAGDARWTVRGVPSNIRNMATKAAKSRGMTVGDWLAETIALSARKEVSADESKNLPAVLSPEVEELFKTMNERLTSIEDHQSQGILGSLLGRRKGRQKAA
jgi:hypothetical protein